MVAPGRGGHVNRRLLWLAAPAFLLLVPAVPAGAAATTGYVRLAHLSPDTPDVDVYLSSVSNPGGAQKFPGVGYGDVSTYQRLATGTYAVAMRLAGAADTTPPVLTTQVSVAVGKAYTVAGVGKHADLGLRIIDDDVTLPAEGRSKVRVVQASVRAPVLNVSVVNGATVATNVAFATTTGYQQVAPGQWTLRVEATGDHASTTLPCTLGAGNVYTLLVLDAQATGFEGKLLVDARRQGGVPVGGVETGAGGTQRGPGVPPLVIAVLALGAAVALGSVALRRRRSLDTVAGSTSHMSATTDQ